MRVSLKKMGLSLVIPVAVSILSLPLGGTVSVAAPFSCSKAMTSSDTAVKEKLTQAVLPAIEGSVDNIPLSLKRTSENRILFGMESEFDLYPALLAHGKALEQSREGILRFYSHSGRGPFSKALAEGNLSKRPLSELTDLSPQERELYPYLPSETVPEQSEVATQELVSDILPNQATFLKLFRSVNSAVGQGSAQAMMSIPRAAVLSHGQREIEGLLMLTNDLSTLSAILKPRANHPFLEPFNSPLGNFGGLDRGQNFRLGLASFFDQPNLRSGLIRHELDNPKYTLGAAVRIDLSDRHAGKSRFFIEIRGCKYNPDCVEKFVNQFTNIFENEITGFAEFAQLETLVAGPLSSPWRLSPVWKSLPSAESLRITRSLSTLFSNKTHPYLHLNFLYPLKAFDMLSLQRGFPKSELLAAQLIYLGELTRASNLNEASEALRILTSALQNFASSSHLHEYFSNQWQRVTGTAWDIQF